MLNYLIEKLPLVRAWIDATLNQHAAISQSVKNLASMQNFSRLPHYFTDNFLSHAKCIVVNKVPLPPLSQFGLTDNVFSDFEKGDYDGITYKNTYFIKRECFSDEALHFHELVHVVQWQHLGVDKFLLTYALGLIKNGRKESPLEKMAYNHQQRFMGDSKPYSVADCVRSELDALMPGIFYEL